MPIECQSNANPTPIECQINATQIVDSSSQKERLAHSKLCRDIYFSAKKISPKAAKNPSVLSLLFLSISFCYCNTFKLIFNFLCSLSRFTLLESSSENFNVSHEHLQVQQENLKLNQSCSHFY